ncbi:LOW QUALITY PROTEIN: hypothetical protein T265_13008 [Opisthorchis viverrini]|uniref:Uncharacterized protein n=1 Tax=Opisthorchis viverrini TaxID=6198 RepID=A0A074ZUX6_OPIVI|nr:LOW QUALITY PROTEIN: hypothetical protein T265_13008 [Opisthorchis viverrini]KER31253.1 LOW QUALITY PROTEIN: hypothetical protein T265_13008 [Opisthorchis viverrini]
MALDTIQNVENYIRDLAKDRRSRFSENFLDYDNLRSGYVTTGQFFRVLRNIIGVPLRNDAEELILQKYGVNENKDVNWRQFAQEIEGKFDVNDFTRMQSSEDNRVRSLSKADRSRSYYVGSKAPHKRPGDEKYDSLRPILSRINQFIGFQGYIIRDCYKQFDVHNVGLVTESQFYRSFPGPTDISEAELTMLVERYKSNTHPGFVDYLAFERELRELQAAEGVAKMGQPTDMKEGICIPEPKEDFLRPSVELIIDRIRFAIHRRGVRVMDFFVDYDKLRHDAVTENQFVCALMMAIAKEAQLSREEVQMLANCYRKHSNPRMIAYREFCRQVDAPFHTLHLEKDPLKQPNMPKTGELTRGVATLTTEEEQRVSRILDDLRAKVEKRRIMTYPYFRDYDLGTGVTRIVSDTQFGRVLHFLGLTVSPEDCRLLCRKFAEPTTGKVNYTLFCQAIDRWSVPGEILKPDDTSAYCVEQENINFGVVIGDSKSGKKVSRRDWLSTVEPRISSVGDHWPVEVLLDRIRHLVLINRIGLKPWFHDFDQLRSGYMTRSQFARCLTAAGIMRLDLHDLTPTQLNTLADRYVSPNDSNMVNWTKFVEDVETVFTIPELEKQPLTRVLPQETFVQPKPGTADWSTATTEMRENYEDSMSKLRRKIHERRMLLLPDFLAFDKNHRGYVTTNNFRQLVTMFDFSISPAGIDAIIARHANDDGFDYRGFLEVLDPPSPEEIEYKYPERLKTLQMTNILGKKRLEMEPVLRDTEGVLDQIKAEVYRRRIRLSDWFRDHDKLNHGYMPRSTFRRCLGVLPLSIGETAMNMVEDRYKGSQPETIDWRAFCAEIEQVFQTPDLERNPLKEPEVYVPDAPVAQNHLSLDVAKLADGAIVKVADKVRQRRLQLLPLFSDFDETHRMTVSQMQFRRVLMTLDLADMLSEREWSSLYCKYRHPLGVVDNINYLAFIDDVYTAAGMDPRMP